MAQSHVSKRFVLWIGLIFLSIGILFLWIKWRQWASPFVVVWKTRCNEKGLDVLSLAFSPKGDLLASSCWLGTTKLWSVRDGKLVRILGSSSSSIVFSPDGQILATGGRVIKLWSISNGRLLKTLQDKKVKDNFPIAFSPDGKFLAASSGDIKIWAVNRGHLVRILSVGSPSYSVSFSPNGRFLASGHSDGAVRIWAFPNGNLLKVLKAHNAEVNCVAFSPDGRILASGGDDGTIKLWWVLEGKMKTILTSGARVNLETLLTSGIIGYFLRLLDPSPLDVESVAFSPDGKLLASEGQDGVLELWRISDGKRIGKIAFGWKYWLARIVSSYTVVFSPNGQFIAIGDQYGFIHLLRLKVKK